MSCKNCKCNEKCLDCQYYQDVLKLIKKYYRDNILLNTIIKKALKKEDLDVDSLIKDDWGMFI